MSSFPGATDSNCAIFELLIVLSFPRMDSRHIASFVINHFCPPLSVLDRFCTLFPLYHLLSIAFVCCCPLLSAFLLYRLICYQSLLSAFFRSCPLSPLYRLICYQSFLSAFVRSCPLFPSYRLICYQSLLFAFDPFSYFLHIFPVFQSLLFLTCLEK